MNYGPVVQRQRLLAYNQATVVRVHPGLLTPRYANGRAVRLKPECLQVRILLWALSMTSWLGRQLADHLGLEPGMLWVRVPPELLKISVLVEQPGVLATLSRWRSRVQIPPGTLLKTARYANRQSGQAQTLVTVCRFDSDPCH